MGSRGEGKLWDLPNAAIPKDWWQWDSVSLNQIILTPHSSREGVTASNNQSTAQPMNMISLEISGKIANFEKNLCFKCTPEIPATTLAFDFDSWFGALLTQGVGLMPNLTSQTLLPLFFPHSHTISLSGSYSQQSQDFSQTTQRRKLRKNTHLQRIIVPNALICCPGFFLRFHVHIQLEADLFEFLSYWGWFCTGIHVAGTHNFTFLHKKTEIFSLHRKLSLKSLSKFLGFVGWLAAPLAENSHFVYCGLHTFRRSSTSTCLAPFFWRKLARFSLADELVLKSIFIYIL